MMLYNCATIYLILYVDYYFFVSGETRSGEDMELKTPLYEWHEKNNGKLVPFANFLLPIQYDDIIAEHMNVREHVGLFDISHMGRIELTGQSGELLLEKICTNRIGTMKEGQVRYTLLCNQQGQILDDVLIYKIDQTHFFMVANASNREKILEHLHNQNIYDVSIKDHTFQTAAIAIQGPESEAVLRNILPPESLPVKYYTFLNDQKILDSSCMISRTGYTGEDGFEISCDAFAATKIWKLLMEIGREYHIKPCGLGARDTLRMEAAMPLYGHELSLDRNPLEAGLQRFVDLTKENFIGKEFLQQNQNSSLVRVGIKVCDRGIVREHCDLFVDEKNIGCTTSGTFLPFLNGAYAMGYVDRNYSQIGTKLYAFVRNRLLACEICSLPFYKKGDQRR